MANGARRTLWQPSGAVGQQLPWYQQGPYLPMTYRQYPRMAFGGGSLGPRQDELAQAGLGAFGPATMGDPGVLPPGFVTAGQAGLVQQPVQVSQPAPAPMTYLPLAGAPSPLAAQAAQAMSQFRPAARGGATGLGGVGAETAGAAGAQAASIAEQFRAFGEGDREAAAGGPFRDPIDPRIDTAWYHAFQAEHDGQTPEEFYTGLPYDQLKYNRYDADRALTEALDDLEWSRGFRSYAGKDPTDDDWKAWWMHNYGRDMRTDKERERDKEARKGGAGRKLPRFRDRGQEAEPRPPLWVPPVTYWR